MSTKTMQEKVKRFFQDKTIGLGFKILILGPFKIFKHFFFR